MRILLIAALIAGLTSGRAVEHDRLITIDVHDAAIGDVLALLAAESGTNIVADTSVKPEPVTMQLRNVTFQRALAVLLGTHRLRARREGNVLVVSAASASSTEARVAMVPVRHADPAEVAKAIEKALPANTVIVPDQSNARIVISADPEGMSQAQALIRALDSNPSGVVQDTNIRVYHLRYARSEDVAAALKAVLPDGSFIADDGQNALTVKGNQYLQKMAARFLEGIDVASPQVLFEVRVADVRPINEQSDVGLQFGGYDLSGQPIMGAAAYAFTRSSLAINARLNALISSGHAQILATPKLLTLNNHEADLLIGETYPVVYYDARLGGQQVQFVDIGVKLRLRATIGSDGSVTAEMHPEYSAIEGFVGGYPVLTNRKVDSTLRVSDGETIVLGGLLRDIDSETLTKVPGLSSIPIFGKLFEDRQRMHQRDEVVFLITPHVLFSASSPQPK